MLVVLGAALAMNPDITRFHVIGRDEAVGDSGRTAVWIEGETARPGASRRVVRRDDPSCDSAGGAREESRRLNSSP